MDSMKEEPKKRHRGTYERYASSGVSTFRREGGCGGSVEGEDLHKDFDTICQLVLHKQVFEK